MKGANYLHLTASAYVGSVMLMLMSKCEPAQTAINFLVCGHVGKTLALVFSILQITPWRVLKAMFEKTSRGVLYERLQRINFEV